MAGFAPEVLGLLNGLGIGAPLGTGKVFFVDWTNGDDTNPGTDPDKALKTITAALGKCVTKHNDYIVVMDFSTIPSPPLVLPADKTDIHIIALGSGNFDSGNDLNGGAAVALRIPSGAYDYEIAGLNIGGAGAHYGLEVEAGQVAYREHIHHCTFGNNFGVTDGINAWSFSNSLIDHCLFGSAVTSEGIEIGDGSMLMLRDNLFHSCDVGSIRILGGPNFILDNMFAHAKAAATGWAINISGAGGTIMGNKASETGDHTTGNNPYRDQSVAGVANKLNAWAWNWKGEQVETPAD